MITVSVTKKRPSGHVMTLHQEAIDCPTEKRHADEFLQFMDIVAYQCGIDRKEFKVPGGWTHSYGMLLDVLEAVRALIPSEKQHNLDRTYESADPLFSGRCEKDDHALYIAGPYEICRVKTCTCPNCRGLPA